MDKPTPLTPHKIEGMGSSWWLFPLYCIIAVLFLIVVFTAPSGPITSPTYEPSSESFYSWLPQAVAKNELIGELLESCANYNVLPKSGIVVDKWEGDQFAIMLFENGHIAYKHLDSGFVNCLRYELP